MRSVKRSKNVLHSKETGGTIRFHKWVLLQGKVEGKTNSSNWKCDTGQKISITNHFLEYIFNTLNIHLETSEGISKPFSSKDNEKLGCLSLMSVIR